MPLFLGLAWDVGNKGRTVMRLSAGLYDSRTSSVLFLHVLFLHVLTNNDLVTKDYSLDERSGACGATISSTIPNNCGFRGPGAVVTFPNILASFLTSLSGLNDRARSRA
jgi:hypothetical protein